VCGSVELNLRSVLSLLHIAHIRFIRRHFFLETSAYILQTEYRLLCVATVLGSCQSSPGGTRPHPICASLRVWRDSQLQSQMSGDSRLTITDVASDEHSICDPDHARMYQSMVATAERLQGKP
jgi:hypothetical protein